MNTYICKTDIRVCRPPGTRANQAMTLWICSGLTKICVCQFYYICRISRVGVARYIKFFDSIIIFHDFLSFFEKLGQ